MRISRKLMLLALTALAALAFASPANAQSVSVVAEGGAPCPDVSLSVHDVTGGCDVHVVSEQETQIVAGTAGGPMVISTCEDEFDAKIDANGHGYIHDVFTEGHVGAACTRTACDEANSTQIPWEIELGEDAGGGYAHVSFCLRNVTSAPGTAGTPCEVVIPMTQTTNPHQQHFNAEAGAPCLNLPPGAVTVRGHWHTETTSEIDVNHL